MLDHIDNTYITPIAAYFQQLHPTFTSIPNPKSSLIGSWYVSAKQHVVEWILENPLFILMSYVFLSKALQKGSKLYQCLQKHKPRNYLYPSEYLLVGLTAFSLGLRCFYLYNNNSVIFLLQPCHLYATMIILLSFAPNRSKTVQVLFNVMLYILWGALLAVLFPDFRDYRQFFELENFWLEHSLVLLAPFYFIYTSKFALLPFQFNFAIGAWSLFAVYHSLILDTAGLYFGRNLNYLMAPPPNTPLGLFGEWYRPVMYFFTIWLNALFGFLYVRVGMWVLSLATKKRGVAKKNVSPKKNKMN